MGGGWGFYGGESRERSARTRGSARAHRPADVVLGLGSGVWRLRSCACEIHHLSKIKRVVQAKIKNGLCYNEWSTDTVRPISYGKTFNAHGHAGGVQHHPRSDAKQSQKSISRVLREIDTKSGFNLPERQVTGAISFYKCHA